MNAPDIKCFATGVRNLDLVLGGSGLPEGALIVFGGAPGTGKTILAQQIAFQHASPERKVLFIQTLSEPMSKTLRYLKPFDFFDAGKIDKSVFFADLGDIVRIKGVDRACDLMMQRVKDVRPALVVIDSFRVFQELASAPGEYRRFAYEVAVNLTGWGCTSFLLGEFSEEEITNSALASIVDGILKLSTRELIGESQRFVQVMKLRGRNHSREEHPLVISSKGIEIYPPRTLAPVAPPSAFVELPRLAAEVKALDALLEEEIPVGSSLLVSGAAGTGKTALCLEAVCRGAEKGQRGIYFGFEEDPGHLISLARRLGCDLDGLMKKGLVELVTISQPGILMERDLLMMEDRIKSCGAQRIVVDSLSSFFHRVTDVRILRDKMYYLCAMVRQQQGVGFFVSDTPCADQRFGQSSVAESIADGVVTLGLGEKGGRCARFIQVNKLRNTKHSHDKSYFEFTSKGLLPLK